MNQFGAKFRRHRHLLAFGPDTAAGVDPCLRHNHSKTGLGNGQRCGEPGRICADHKRIRSVECGYRVQSDLHSNTSIDCRLAYYTNMFV